MRPDSAVTPRSLAAGPCRPGLVPVGRLTPTAVLRFRGLRLLCLPAVSATLAWAAVVLPIQAQQTRPASARFGRWYRPPVGTSGQRSRARSLEVWPGTPILPKPSVKGGDRVGHWGGGIVYHRHERLTSVDQTEGRQWRSRNGQCCQRVMRCPGLRELGARRSRGCA